MPRRKLRSQSEVVERCRALHDELRDALARLPDGDDPAVVDAVWHGEALGTLLWALQLAELPPYDTPFDPDEVARRDARRRDAARRATRSSSSASRRGSGTGARARATLQAAGGRRAAGALRERSTS